MLGTSLYSSGLPEVLGNFTVDLVLKRKCVKHFCVLFLVRTRCLIGLNILNKVD